MKYFNVRLSVKKIYIYVVSFLKNFFKDEKVVSSKEKIFCHLEIYWFCLGKSFLQETR